MEKSADMHRKLRLRTKVLRSQLVQAMQSKELGQELRQRIRESVKSLDDEHHHKLRLNQEKLYQERRQTLADLSKRLELARTKILTRTRGMLRDLWSVYPIVEFPDQRGYSICDIHLPNSESFEGHDETMVSVAVGYVGHLLILLADILDISLRFPLKYFGSKSLIYCSRRQQLFPLYVDSSKSRDWVNFAYAISLLNLDIVQIRTLYGMPTTDPDETLANLHGLRQTLDRDL